MPVGTTTAVSGMTTTSGIITISGTTVTINGTAITVSGITTSRETIISGTIILWGNKIITDVTKDPVLRGWGLFCYRFLKRMVRVIAQSVDKIFISINKYKLQMYQRYYRTDEKDFIVSDKEVSMQIKVNSNENQVISLSSAAQERAARKAGGKTQNNNKATIFAGDLGIGMQNDIVTQRKQRAQKKALKMITDAWNGDRKIDQTIEGYRDKIAQLKAEIEQNMEQIQMRDEWKENLRQDYGVAENSQEQKDLELLEKEADVEANKTRRNPKNIYLTDEEQERLSEIHEQGLTEYQERCMKIDGQQGRYESEIDKLQTEIQGYSKAITSTKQERLKYHDMVDAQEKAEDLMAAASREAIGLLMDEAKDHVDEELEEQVEKAKKEAQEKAEKEEKIEERKEKQEELEARIDETRAKREEQEARRREAEERSREDAELLDSMLEVGMGGIGVTKADVKAAIKEMLHKMKLLEEDIKGSLIDEDVSDY